MGQAWASPEYKLQVRRWKERQLRKMAEKVSDRAMDDAKKREVAPRLDDVYTAVLCVYNDMNKYLPGPPGHRRPPSKERLKAMMDEYDVSLEVLLDREEFTQFIRKDLLLLAISRDQITEVKRNILLQL